MEYQYATRVSAFQASDVRELLKVTENDEIISFGGGLPAPELFPLDEILEANRRVLKEQGRRALQYSTTEGYAPLREWIAARMNEKQGMALERDHILITNGSQQGLDLVGKLFLNAGDVVLCESPTYLAALSAFRSYECRFREVETDDAGMLPGALEEALGAGEAVKLIYVVTNFQNPSGRSWSAERRKKLYELASRYEVLVLEDNPYGELRFEGEDIPLVQALDKRGLVLSLGTFSKTFCPGYRIGWVAGSREVVEKLVLAKQGADLQCNTLAQMEIVQYLQDYDIDAHIDRIKTVYLHRRDLAVQTMEQVFPAGVSFTRPQGGLFLWVTLPEHINTRELLTESLARKVAFVPGGTFFPNSSHENTMRINFSNMPEERIVRGLTILGELLHTRM